MPDWNKYVGIPYKLHGASMRGCDCYGLLVLIFAAEFGITLPEFHDQYNGNSDDDTLVSIYEDEVGNWKEVTNPKPGDVVYFKIAGQPKHVGMVIDDSRFIHNLKGSSTIGEFTNNRWKQRVIGFYRYG